MLKYLIVKDFIEQMERKKVLNKPDEIRPIERVDVSFDFARSNTLTSNFISIFGKIITKKECDLR